MHKNPFMLTTARQMGSHGAAIQWYQSPAHPTPRAGCPWMSGMSQMAPRGAFCDYFSHFSYCCYFRTTDWQGRIKMKGHKKSKEKEKDQRQSKEGGKEESEDWSPPIGYPFGEVKLPGTPRSFISFPSAGGFLKRITWHSLIFFPQTLNLAAHAAAINVRSPGKAIQLQISSL